MRIFLFSTAGFQPISLKTQITMLQWAIDHFTVVAKLPGLRMEARLSVTLF